MIVPALLLLLAPAPLEDPWTPLEGTRPAQWRLVWTQDPAHGVGVSWTTLEAGSTHRVHFDTRPRAAEAQAYAGQVTAHRSGAYTLDPAEVEEVTGAHYHHARLKGLAPSTTYWFQLESDGVRSPELHFRTAPAEDRPFKLLHGGDSRTGIRERQQINRFIGELADEHPELITFAHGGDYIAWGRRWAQWRLWLSQNELTTSPTGRVLPMIPARGNHDPGPLFDEIFDDPGGAGLNYYATDLTPAVSLITLNSEISAAGDQAVWLESELARLRPERRWLLTQYHRALYPAVKDPGSAKAHWVPLFEEFDLDIALESDGHAVKRTVPIRGEAQDPTGVIYIGEGGLGVPQRAPKSERWFLQAPGMSGRSHHVVLLEFGQHELRSRLLAPSTTPLSRFTPEDHTPVLPADASWRYLAGSDPADSSWLGAAFDDSDWNEGVAGFGYGDEDDATVLEEMQGTYSRVYLRTELDPVSFAGLDEVLLAVRYDDAFIAYLAGAEVVRAGIERGSGPSAEGIASHEAKGWELFSLGSGAALAERLGQDPVVLCVEGHNTGEGSSDFTLQPCLIGPRRARSPAPGGAVLLDEFKLKPRAQR